MTETLEQYKARIDAKYREAGKRTKAELAQREKARKHSPHWLLINPAGRIDGCCVNHCAESEIEAFEFFFPAKKERMARAAEGWHIELDDEAGTRMNAFCDEITSANRKGADA